MVRATQTSIAKRFFNKYEELREIASQLSDAEIEGLTRGGHDPVKIHAAFDAATRVTGRPTVILAQTKKGYGLGRWAESRMSAHQQKKLTSDALRSFRDRFDLPLSDEDVENARFYRPAPDSPEMRTFASGGRNWAASYPNDPSDPPAYGHRKPRCLRNSLFRRKTVSSQRRLPLFECLRAC